RSLPRSPQTRYMIYVNALIASLLVANVVTPHDAQADDCKSGTQIATAIWSDWGDEIKKGGCLTGVAVPAVLSQGATASAAKPMYDACYDTLAKFEEAGKKTIAKWNSLVGNTWASLGPRPLTFGTKLKGTVVSTGGRVFITPAPLPAHTDEVEIKLEKTGGKGKTSVTACKISANGKAEQLWSFTIDPGDENEGKTWSRKFKNLNGYILSVHLDCKSLSKKMEYELTASVKEK
ncbi:MAG: hypothetical protein KJ070_24425, partial [Verrucomicrobia bacterium]|nr:hypothetical protein [Verrucomicrobiota bacterium]